MEFLQPRAASFAYVRQGGSFHYLPAEQAWLILDAKDIHTILGAPQIFSSHTYAGIHPELLGADPPEHTGRRALIQPFFTPSALPPVIEFARATAASLGAAMAKRASFDFVTDFALALTYAVSTRLIGLSESESRALHNCVTGHLYEQRYTAGVRSFFAEYFSRRQPSDPPVMLDRIAEQVGPGGFTPHNAVNLAMLMWESGVITTSMIMTTTMRYLLTYPAVAEQLRADPARIDPFLEEMLRLEAPASTLPRITTQAVTVSGRDFPAGTVLICCVTAANRDPARFPNPDEVNLERKGVRHLTFAGGAHACAGAYLARLETRLAIQWLLEQGSTLRLADPFLPSYVPLHALHALASLRLRWSRAGTAASMLPK